MKYTVRALLVNAALMLAVSQDASACGPYNPIIPTPDFFVSSAVRTAPKRDFEREENIRLWQQLTSPEIPVADIEEAVYKDSFETFGSRTSAEGGSETNLFYVYLRNTNDWEIKSFLLTAKRIEEARKKKTSPWYYPSSRNDCDPEGLMKLAEECVNYKGTRLRDRYGLQGVRAYFAANEYEKCIKFYEDVFDDIPESNLFKRMSMRYVGGCWLQLEDDTQEGEYESAAEESGWDYIAAVQPDCPELITYARECAGDSTRFCALRPMAEKILQNPNTRYRGDWEFALAYMDGHFHKDYKSAATHINRALALKFSDEDFMNCAHAYRTKVEAANGNMTHLTADLLWFEKITDVLNPDAYEWTRKLKNIAYVDWIPALWEKGDYATAILLCGFAENMDESRRKHLCRGDSPYTIENNVLTLDEIRASQREFNYVDYSGLYFQLMGSLTSEQLISVKNQMAIDKPLYRILKKYARTDSPYIDELIGTLAIREENYERAVQYLSRVPLEYQKTMNIYKGDCLRRDPFALHPTRCKADFQDNAKFNFARRMVAYKKTIKTSASADKRGIAKIMYAIGRRNQFGDCWALTQYWSGYVDNIFKPRLNYYCDLKDFYGFLYDLTDHDVQETDEERMNREIEEGMAMLRTDEARARAQYLLRNLATVVKIYPKTSTAEFVRKSCDSWREWL